MADTVTVAGVTMSFAKAREVHVVLTRALREEDTRLERVRQRRQERVAVCRMCGEEVALASVNCFAPALTSVEWVTSDGRTLCGPQRLHVPA